jgi:O-antigen/teichoic acid export membrane protein
LVDIRNKTAYFKNIFLGQFSSVISFLVSTGILFINLYYFSVEERGIYGLIYTMPSLLIILTDFGFTPVFIRYISKNSSNTEMVSSIIVLHILRVFLTTIIGIFFIKFAAPYIYKIKINYLYFALPIIFSLSANSYLTPYFYGINRIIKYYIFLIFPSFCILCISVILIVINSFNLINIITASIFIYVIHSILVLFSLIKKSGIKSIKYFKDFNAVFNESKFLYFSNTLTFGFIYLFPILINYKFGITNLSLILFCIAICDKLFLIGDSVGYEIIRKININIYENKVLKFDYLKKVIILMLPILLLCAFIMFYVTKYILIEYFFIKYRPIIPFFTIILLQYFFQAFQRIFFQFYNGLGMTKFTLYTTLVGIILKTIILFLSNNNIQNSLFKLLFIDFCIFFFLIFMTRYFNRYYKKINYVAS